MPDVSLRGLDAATLSRIKSTARRRKTSVNRLIVETLERAYGSRPAAAFDDLGDLAGAWSKREAAEFDSAVAPFSEIDAAMWAAQPQAGYSIKRARTRSRG